MSCSVHWRPLHLHPYYEETFGWRPDDLPVASDVWPRLVSLPLFSAMRRDEIDAVVSAVERSADGPRGSSPHHHGQTASSDEPRPGAATSCRTGTDRISMRVLMITCEWPTPELPHAVPFVVRQVDFLRKAGVDIDVFSFRGARNPLNYLKAWYRRAAASSGRRPMT